MIFSDRKDGMYWTDLLRFHPEYADDCEWETLEGWNWSSFLCYRPEFYNKCDWSKLNEIDWHNLLLEQNQFCVKRISWANIPFLPWKTSEENYFFVFHMRRFMQPNDYIILF